MKKTKILDFAILALILIAVIVAITIIIKMQ